MPAALSTATGCEVLRASKPQSIDGLGHGFDTARWAASKNPVDLPLRLDDANARIASPENVPEAEALSHLICSRPMFIGGANDEADQHGGA